MSPGAPNRVSRLVLLLLLLLGFAAATRRNLAASQRCDLCEHNWLFILSAGGRTGSTTALSMLNAIPGVELEGEHAGALLHMADFAEAMEKTNRSRGYSWHSREPDYHGIKCEMQEMVRHMLLGRDFAALDDHIKVRPPPSPPSPPLSPLLPPAAALYLALCPAFALSACWFGLLSDTSDRMCVPARCRCWASRRFGTRRQRCCDSCRRCSPARASCSISGSVWT